MKILHLPASVGGNAIGLSQGEKAIGLDSRVLTFGKTRFNYPQDICINVEDKNIFLQGYKRLQAFLKYRTEFDIYHFNFGSTLIHAPQYGLNLLDLPFYKKDAKIFFMYQGCDARQKYPTMQRNQEKGLDIAACFEKNCYAGVCNSGKRDTWRQKSINKAAEYATHFFTLNPDLFYFLPKDKVTLLPYTIPNFHHIEPKTEPFFKNDKIRIGHAPSNQEVKGTKYILKALSDLQEEFPNKIEIVLIENKPHQEALAIYRTLDFFVDQVLIGWYGAVAVEVMKMGVPVGVFINRENEQFLDKPYFEALPFINMNKFNIKSIIKKILENREWLLEKQKEVVAFVNQWHSPERIARIVNNHYTA